MGLPTVMALTIILDTATGIPTAILNATRLTDMRTGAAGAIAAKYLAPRKDCVLGVIGTGRRQKRRSGPPYRNSPSPVSGSGAGIPFMLNLLPDGLPPLPQKVYLSKKPATAMSLSPRHHPAHPLLKANGYMQYAHQCNRRRCAGKEELDPEILHRARVFVDDPAQAFHSGEINVPITKGLFQPWMIAGTLGEIVIGKRKRERPDEITVFDSTGLAIQDLAIASIAMRQSTGMELPFL